LRDLEWYHRGPFTTRGETTSASMSSPASRSTKFQHG
jgi:hypothetical protein